MADEQEKYEIQDDGEYHFTDDNSYDVDSPEAVAHHPAVAKADLKTQVTTFIQQNKKPLMGAVAFVVLILIVYLFLSPGSNAPATEFAAQNTNAKVVPAKPALPAAIPTPPPAVTQATPTHTEMPAVTQTAAAPVIETPPAVIINNAMPPVTTTQSQGAAENYMPRSAEVDNELNALQGKLQDMNARMANMESTLTRLSQMIQELKTAKPQAANGNAPMKARAKPFVPKMNFSVQAIIPGRAWLKSENGDTVTVTQGDILQGYGRVVKIDPYDGNVQVDVGGRIISLPYGNGSE